MTDLVERLRTKCVCREAATEIERLRAENEQLKSKLRDCAIKRGEVWAELRKINASHAPV